MTASAPPAAPPVANMAEAIARMQAIDAALPTNDGLAYFNRMYLGFTRQIATTIGQNLFADPGFLAHLDVVFVNIYLDAVNALTTRPHSLPVAWAPLLDHRGDTDIEPIQFALAGMNAHINNDLPMALVTSCAQLGTAPDAGSHHDDYRTVDQLLAAAEQSVRQSFESGLVLAADRHLQAVANVTANWSITAARDAAWNNAMVLWTIRDIGIARNVLIDSIAHTVAMTSRVLLAPV